MIQFLEEFQERLPSIERKRNTQVSVFSNCLLRIVISELIVDFDFLRKSKETWLPLENFDDSTYDDYSCQGWIDKKIDEDGNHRKLTGKGLKITEDSWSYEPIEILNYSEQDELFEVMWKKDKEKGKLKRIYVCFDAEDPRKYV